MTGRAAGRRSGGEGLSRLFHEVQALREAAMCFRVAGVCGDGLFENGPGLGARPNS